MGRFDRNEVIAALAMMAFGLLWLAIGLKYSWGSSVRIGAGVFPVALSVILIVLCAALVVMARSAAHWPFDFRTRPAVLILGGILIWTLLVDVIGFVPSTATLVAMCALAERDSTWRTVVGLIAFLCAFGYVVFIVALKIPLAVFWE